MNNKPFTTIQGEKDAEIGRKLERGQQINPGKARQFIAADKKGQKDWQMDIEELEKQDKEKREKDIKKLKKYLEEVADKERKRQEEMRKRVEEITKERLESGKSGRLGKDKGDLEGPGGLVEPGTKRRRGSFLQKLKRKGKGAIAEARGAIAKGGG